MSSPAAIQGNNKPGYARLGSLPEISIRSTTGLIQSRSDSSNSESSDQNVSVLARENIANSLKSKAKSKMRKAVMKSTIGLPFTLLGSATSVALSKVIKTSDKIKALDKQLKALAEKIDNFESDIYFMEKAIDTRIDAYVDEKLLKDSDMIATIEKRTNVNDERLALVARLKIVETDPTELEENETIESLQKMENDLSQKFNELCIKKHALKKEKKPALLETLPSSLSKDSSIELQNLNSQLQSAKSDQLQLMTERSQILEGRGRHFQANATKLFTFDAVRRDILQARNFRLLSRFAQISNKPSDLETIDSDYLSDSTKIEGRKPLKMQITLLEKHNSKLEMQIKSLESN